MYFCGRIVFRERLISSVRLDFMLMHELRSTFISLFIFWIANWHHLLSVLPLFLQCTHLIYPIWNSSWEVCQCCFWFWFCVQWVRCVWRWGSWEGSSEVYMDVTMAGGSWPWLVSQPSCLTCCFFFAPSTCSWPSRGLSSCWALLWCWASSWGATYASVCTWPLPTRPLTSGTEVPEPGASIAPTWPGPRQQSPRFTGTFTPVGFGATFARSFYLLLHITRERRNKNGKSVTAF